MGGNKGPDIQKHWLLRNYRDQFTHFISQKNTRLLIIGYSFSDTHINEIIENAAKSGAKIFIIDINGIDVLDNAPRNSNEVLAFKDRIFSSIAGGSRRTLRSTFSTDHVERAKIMRFLTRLGPEG
jgi:hypothetical protein